MIKRGRPKGATAYPETAVCIKCRVFRPKRRGFCDRCRPRNRSTASKTSANSMAASTAATRPPSSSSPSSPPHAAATDKSTDERDRDTVLVKTHPPVAVQASDNRPNALERQPSPPLSARSGTEPAPLPRGVKRSQPDVDASGRNSSAAQIREKRRRTVSAPVPTRSGQIAALLASAAMQPNATTTLERGNRNVDVVSAYGGSATGLVGRESRYASSTGGSPAHQLALLLPRSDGTAVDVVPLQFVSSASPTATAASPALSSPYGSSTGSPASSPSVNSSTHSLMSLANVSALAAARYPSPSHHSASSSSSWSSSPSSSPPRPLLSSSPYSSPSTASPFGMGLAEPRPNNSKAGDLVLPSLCSLALPRPALPRHFFPAHGSGIHLSSMVATSPSASLRLAPN